VRRLVRRLESHRNPSRGGIPPRSWCSVRDGAWSRHGLAATGWLAEQFALPHGRHAANKGMDVLRWCANRVLGFIGFTRWRGFLAVLKEPKAEILAL